MLVTLGSLRDNGVNQKYRSCTELLKNDWHIINVTVAEDPLQTGQSKVAYQQSELASQ